MLKEELLSLYKQINECHICPQMDLNKEIRRIDSINFSSDVFIISQTLAESTLRKTGVNFFDQNGNIGKTGKNLEKFLNLFNRTVYPPNEIMLKNGSKISRSHDNYISVYNTEIAQCYPGKKGNNDRKPTKVEIENCFKNGFFESELKLLKPKLILLMGNVSRNTFFSKYMRVEFPLRLSDHLNEIILSKNIPKYMDIFVIPIQHASPANPSFNKMFDNKGLIKIIKEILNEQS